eukprot:4617436-Prymnesium_polylepis.1
MRPQTCNTDSYTYRIQCPWTRPKEGDPITCLGACVRTPELTFWVQQPNVLCGLVSACYLASGGQMTGSVLHQPDIYQATLGSTIRQSQNIPVNGKP